MYTLVNFFCPLSKREVRFQLFYGPSTLLMIPYRIFSVFNHVSNSLLQQTFHPIANHIIVKAFTNKSVILESNYGISDLSVIDEEANRFYCSKQLFQLPHPVTSHMCTCNPSS